MKHTEETKQKIRESIVAQNEALGEEGRKEKYGKQNKGRKHTKEQNEAKSIRMKEEYASGKRKPALKGKSTKSLMTEEKWLQRNDHISITRKKRFAIGTIVQVHKGKTYEELFTPEKVQALKARISETKSGENAPMKNLETKAKMMKSAKNSWKNGRKPPINNNIHGGIKEDLGHYVRSNWEANICRLLKFLKKEYIYEPRSFSVIDVNGNECFYIPDLQIKSTNIFIEIKGKYYLTSFKHLLFKEQYPEYFLGIIDLKKYRILSKKYSKIVSNWKK